MILVWNSCKNLALLGRSFKRPVISKTRRPTFVFFVLISQFIEQTLRKYQTIIPSWGEDVSRKALKLVNLTINDRVIRSLDSNLQWCISVAFTALIDRLGCFLPKLSNLDTASGIFVLVLAFKQPNPGCDENVAAGAKGLNVILIINDGLNNTYSFHIC